MVGKRRVWFYGRSASSDDMPGVILYGLAPALQEGWELLPYCLETWDSNETVEAWRGMRGRGAVVVDVKASRGGRVWWFGLPPLGWVGSLRRVAERAGMCREVQTFRWIRERG